MVVGSFSYLSLRLQFSIGGMHLFSPIYWFLLAFTVAVVLVALFAPEFTRAAVPGVALLLCLSLAVALRPLDGPLGQYSADAQQYVSGKQVWVPCNFRAVDEGYRFSFLAQTCTVIGTIGRSRSTHSTRDMPCSPSANRSVPLSNRRVSAWLVSGSKFAAATRPPN